MGLGLLFGACAPTTISPNWGVAYQEMRAKQVLNPTAGEKLDPVEGPRRQSQCDCDGSLSERFRKA